MMTCDSENFRDIWIISFLFSTEPGEVHKPLALSAVELRSNTCITLNRQQLAESRKPPYAVDSKSLFVTYFAPNALQCHLSLGWPSPARILDLYAEFRTATNGLPLPCGTGLIGACVHFGLNVSNISHLSDGVPVVSSANDKQNLEDCEQVTQTIRRLYFHFTEHNLIDGARALQRGRYMVAVARMEQIGVPLDTDALTELQERWSEIQDILIRRIDSAGVYDGRRFSANRWLDFMQRCGIAWPRLDSGAPALDDETFREMSRSHPEVSPYRELRHALSQMRLRDLSVGEMGVTVAHWYPFDQSPAEINQATLHLSLAPPSGSDR